MSFLESLFGPSKDKIWQQFADAVGGDFTASDFGKVSKVEATHDQWIVTLDTYAVSTGKSVMVYTRIRAPYVNPDDFHFAIYRKTIFSNLGKMLGMQDVTVGYPAFDEEFIIKGNDEAKLRRLFANQKIRDLIDCLPEVQFSIEEGQEKMWGGRTLPSGVNELYFQNAGVIKDIDRLKLLYDLFSETLDELCRIGSASEENPGIKL